LRNKIWPLVESLIDGETSFLVRAERESERKKELERKRERERERGREREREEKGVC
jgi:hypothetical protein